MYTDLAFDLVGDDNICRLAIADKNCGADDKAHTLVARKHNPHGIYEVYDHSFAAIINAIDNTKRLHIVVEDLFPEIAAPRTPTTISLPTSFPKINSNQSGALSYTM